MFLQHNVVGGHRFAKLANGIRAHKSLSYLDISHNKLGNSGFTELFEPISKGKTKLEHLGSRGNELGGRVLDNLLSCVSRFLKILDLSDNKLTEMNGEILQSYATNNVWIEAINVEGNSQVKAESLENIKS